MNIERPNWQLPVGEQMTANLLFGFVFLLTVIYAVYVARKEREAYPYFVLLGAGLTVFYEPINNVLALCTYPEIGQITWIEAFGRRIPLYIGFCYFFYFCGPILWLMRRIRAGVSAARWWRCYLVGVGLATGFELVPIHLGWWKYYGAHQALQILGFPMWWWFANPAGIFASASLFHYLRAQRVLTGSRAVLFVVLVPMAVFAFHGSAGFPVYVALNATSDLTINTAAAVLSMALGVMEVWITATLVPRARLSALSERAPYVVPEGLAPTS